MAGVFEQEWTTIKKGFEQAAKKKKPSEKVLGYFNKASGLTPATADFDKALNARNPADVSKSLTKLRTTATAYVGTLKKSIAAEKDANGLALLKHMETELNDMVDTKAPAAARVRLSAPRCPTPADVLALMRDKAFGAPLLAFAKKKQADGELEFVMRVAAGDRSRKVYDTFIATTGDKSVDVDGDVRTDFEQHIQANDLSHAPWDAAADWIAKSIDQDLIGKYNTEVGNTFK